MGNMDKRASVNGQKYDWACITVTLPHGEATGITEIKYNDEQPIEARYGRGAVARGYGRGNYAASGSFVLDRDEFGAFVKGLTGAEGGGFYDHEPFTIVISYANDNLPIITDTLKGCKITKRDGGGGAQGDDNVSPISCEFTILEPILWDGVPAMRTSANMDK